MRIVATAAKWVFILCLPLLLLTASLGWAVSSLWLYKYGFEKYDVSAATGLAESELKKVATSLISYFNSDEEYINLTVVKNGEPFVLFNQREVAHLEDVKGLIWLDYRILLGTLLYAVAYMGGSLFWTKRRYWQQLAWGVVGGSGLTLALMLALGLSTLLGFDQLFLQFHLISFSNEFWQLDPARDYLIRLFPQGFWYDATLLVALGATLAAVMLGGASSVILILLRRRVTAKAAPGQHE